MTVHHNIPTPRMLEGVVRDCLVKIDRTATRAEIARAVADALGLDQATRGLRDPGDRMPLIDWKCAWALSSLKKKGLVVQPGRGLFALPGKTNGNGVAVPGTDLSSPTVINADSAYRFFLDPARGGQCFEDGRLDRMVTLCEQGARPGRASKEAGLTKREENYLTYLVHSYLPEIVRDARISEGKPHYVVAPTLRARFESNPERRDLIARLVAIKYGEKEQALRSLGEAQPAAPAGAAVYTCGYGALERERVDVLEASCGRIEAKLDQLIAVWAE